MKPGIIHILIYQNELIQILHRDRDYLNDDEVQVLQKQDRKYFK